MIKSDVKEYVVISSVTFITEDGWVGSRMLPTFFLNSTIQGIVDASHAKKIARSMIEDILTINGPISESTKINVDAYPVDY